MSCIDSICSRLSYIISGFNNQLDDPYHVREMMRDNPRKYSDNELDTESIVLDFSRTESSLSRELNHRHPNSKYKEYGGEDQYDNTNTNFRDSDGGLGRKGSSTISDMSEIVPVLGGESEDSNVLHTFWKNVRSVMMDSIDETFVDNKIDHDFVIDMDTMVL